MVNEPFVIFDLDGTLVDSWNSLTECLRRTLESLNRELPSDTFFNQYDIGDIGSMFHDCHRIYTSDIEWKKFKSLSGIVYVRYCIPFVKVIPKGKLLFEKCRAMNLGCVVLTNKYQLSADIICTLLYGPTAFKSIIGRNGIGMIKPHKYAVNRIERCGLDVSLCRGYFGDSHIDETMAARLKVPYWDINSITEDFIR